MNRIVILSLLSLSLSACAQLGLKQEETQAAQKPAGDMASLSPAAGGPVAAAGNSSCNAQASSKLALFDKPDTYPISEAEKKNAYDALYSECLKGLELRANDPKPHFEQNALDTGLANLSPAAGGPAASSTTSVTMHSTPTGAAGVTVIDTAQFAHLSPAAGGTGVINGVSSNGQPVIIVQAAGAAPAAVAATPPVPTHAAAIPVAPVVEKTTTTVTTHETPAPVKPRKQAKAKATQSVKAADKRSRFARNAVSVGTLNSYQPSAGGLIDNAVTTNRPAQKD